MSLSLAQRRAQRWGRMNRQAQRNREIWVRYHEEPNVSKLAREYGLSRARIRQIVGRESQIVASEGARVDMREAA